MLHRIGSYVGRHHIGLLALFVALSGTAYAAVAKNSVGPKQLKTNAVTGIDANEATFDKVPSATAADTATTAGTATTALTAANGVRGYAQVQAAAGDLGSPCTNGPGGNECKIFRSRGVTKATKPNDGTYCVFLPGVSPLSTANSPAAVVAVDVATTDPALDNPVARIYQADNAPCAAGGGFAVSTTDAPSSSDEVGFTILIP